MTFNEISEGSKINKAGFIPYFIDRNNKVHMLFCLSSDPAFGGDKFMIGKGHVDAGESIEQTALREASEELGLKRSNLKADTVQIGWTGQITGTTETSTMTIYIGEVNDPRDFNIPGHEISKVKWFTPEEFSHDGRPSHKHIVQSCASKISSEM